MTNFFLRSNDKKYYITYTIIISGLIISILLIYIFTKPTKTIKIPGQPERPYWPYYIDENGNNTPRRIVDTVSPGPNSDVMVFDKWSFSHISHGIIYFAILYLIKVILKRTHNIDLPVTTILIISLIIEICWEYFENTKGMVIDLQKAGLTNYGDSIVNSAGDIISCLIGVLIASISPIMGLIYIIVSELIFYPNSLAGAIVGII